MMKDWQRLVLASAVLAGLLGLVVALSRLAPEADIRHDANTLSDLGYLCRDLSGDLLQSSTFSEGLVCRNGPARETSGSVQVFTYYLLPDADAAAKQAEPGVHRADMRSPTGS